MLGLRSRRGGNPKLITVAVDGMNEARVVGIRLDLLSESCDGMVDRTRVRQFGIAPDFAQELVAIDHSAIRAKTFKKIYAPCGVRTRDPGLIRPVL